MRKNPETKELCGYYPLLEMRVSSFLEQQGWDDSDIRLVLTHIISRAVYPASELKTSHCIKENSVVCEVAGFDIVKYKYAPFIKKKYVVLKSELED